MQTTIRALIGAAVVVGAFGVAVAKLPPAPPLTDEQKAEKAAKDKATADAEKAELAKAEDKAIANYVANEKAKGKTVNVNPSAGESGNASSGKSLSAQPEKASNAHSPPNK
jgi:membrane protein involved in colicin uptake